MMRSISITAALVVAVFSLNARTRAEAPAGEPSRTYSTVASVDAAAGTVVVNMKDGTKLTVTTDANTKIQVDGKDAKLDDIKAGMVLRISPATGVAADLRAFMPKNNPPAPPGPAPAPQAVYGTVASVEAEQAKVVVNMKDSTQLTVLTDAKTTVQVDGKAATIADIKAGMIIRISPPTGTAADVRAFTPKTAPAR